MAGPVSDKARVTVMRARQLLREKRYADALQVCADELARGADEPRLRLVAAHSLLAQGRHEGAKKEAQQVLRVDPGVAEAHRLLADVACARGEVATACDHLERVITLDPSDGQARRLLESLSRTPMSGGDETVPMSGAMQISGQASSLDRFIADDDLGMSNHADAPDYEDVIESSLEDSILEISDSMMEELPDQPPKRAPRPKVPAADPASDWMPARVQGVEAPMTLSGLDGFPPDGSEEDAPTMPLLRPSAPKEPQLKLDPRAARPVQEERAARRLSRSAEVDLVPERGATTAPVSPSQLVAIDDEDEDNGFEEFGIEAASVPLGRGAPQEIPKVRDPVSAREEMHSAASMAESRRRPRRDSADFVAIEEDDEDPRGDGADLMSMFAAGSDAIRDDDSLDDISAPRSRRGRGHEAPETLDGGALGGFDDGFDADPALGGGGGDEADDDSWDPLAEMGGSGARSNADLDDFESDLAAAGLAPGPTETKSRFKLFLLLFLLAALGAGGGYGYHWYQVQKIIRSEWAKARTALHLGTPAGYADAKKAAERILKKRPKHPGALAAVGMVDAAMSIEFGQDLRAKAKEALAKTKGRDSEWRTATQGFLALIADPSSAVGYLQKGIEVFPKSALLRYLEGRALVATDKEQRAADIFQAALKIAPDFVSARLALASLIGKQDKGYDRADQIFSEVLKGHPGHIQALVERARLRARHNKEIDGAITDMKHIAGDLAKKAGPGQLGWAQLVLAQVYRRRGTITEMAKALDAAIKSPPCCDSFFRYELAGELMGLFRFRDAYDQMKQAITLNPHDPRYLQRIGRLLLDMGRTKEASAQISKAPAGQPETKVLAARLLYATRRYQDAAAAFKPLLAEKKVATEAQLYRAMALAKMRRTTEALAALAALAKKQPMLDTVRLFEGMIFLQIRDYKKAEEALKKAWHINKLDPRTPTFLGHVSLAIHDIDRAIKRYERALKSRPDFAPAHIALGHLRWQIGDLPAARARLAKVHKADRSLISYLVLKMRVALAERHFDVAQKVLQELVQRHPRKRLLSRLRGEMALAQKKGKAALALLAKVSKADPKDEGLLVLLGQAQIVAKKLDDAYDTFHAVLKIDPGQPEALLALGRIAIKDGELPLAIRRLKASLVQMGKRHRPKRQRAAVFSALAQAFLAQKDTGRAMSNLQDAIDLDPSAAEPQYRMGRTYDLLDRPGRAVGYYQKAISNDPTYLSAYRRLVLAYVKLNDKANAVKYLNLYASKAPKAKDLGELQKKVGGLK